ncbi:hypothetical protein CEXT_187371 [Caerostris extrusa]|uniref:Ig-like domain-containing protein n=1 Tax=Caerostris extrusa TaxID=172846 RepID=A0AAV4VUJ7_CAEEX|nr:hypothetical protein CEXT_187371 [Caerostris extrusa]
MFTRVVHSWFGYIKPHNVLGNAIRKKKNHKEEKRGDFNSKTASNNAETSFLVVEKSLTNVTKSSGETVRMKCEVKGGPCPRSGGTRTRHPWSKRGGRWTSGSTVPVTGRSDLGSGLCTSTSTTLGTTSVKQPMTSTVLKPRAYSW